MHLFGSSGIRKVFDQELCDTTLKVARAVGSRYKHLVVGCDARTSSNALLNLAMAGLMTAGAKVVNAGLVPTPTLASMARGFDAALMITASHNPPEYNGIKLLNPDGTAFLQRQQKEIQEITDNNINAIVSWKEVQSSITYNRAVEDHISYIRQFFPDKYKVKVALDCACGAGSMITPMLLQRMGCEVFTLNSEPHGFPPHPVEPRPENLADLEKLVISSGADIGIAHDGDADRMMAFDKKGRFISGDKLLRIFADELAAYQIVTTVDASMSIDETKYVVHRTPVGDSYVSEKMQDVGDFGGEPSGAWIFRKNSFCPDGIFAAAFLVAIAAQKDIPGMIDAIPEYPIIRTSLTTQTRDVNHFETALARAFDPISIEHTDGIKLHLREGWILLRASGTEPKIRLTVETKHQENLKPLVDVISKIIRQ